MSRSLYFKSNLKQFLIFILLILYPITGFTTNKNTTLGTPNDEGAQIKQIENYLNSIDSFRASFSQSDHNNYQRKGRFILSRPDQMRFDYDTDPKETIILTEDYIMHYNQELKEINYISSSAFPISFLSKKHIDLQQDLKILNLANIGNHINLELLVPSEESQQRVILRFSKKPLTLDEFYLQDELGNTTRVKLHNIEVNQPIDEDEFEIDK